jgi:hypothetical protein
MVGCSLVLSPEEYTETLSWLGFTVANDLLPLYSSEMAQQMRRNFEIEVSDGVLPSVGRAHDAARHNAGGQSCYDVAVSAAILCRSRKQAAGTAGRGPALHPPCRHPKLDLPHLLTTSCAGPLLRSCRPRPSKPASLPALFGCQAWWETASTAPTSLCFLATTRRGLPSP